MIIIMLEGEGKMTRKNQFWKGMLLGAIAGGALSLLDKDTREAMKDNVKRTSVKVGYIIRHPHEISEKFKSTFETVSEDISFISEKVEELRELTPQVTEMLKETKETFNVNDQDEFLDDDVLV